MHWIILLLIHLFICSIIQITGKSSGLRIRGGRDAQEHEYPYVVRLEHEMTSSTPKTLVLHLHLCTGAALTPIWILTAAHCLLLFEPIKLKEFSIKPVIRYGPLANATIHDVISTIKSPSCKMRLADIRNDVGLVKSSTITLKQYARVSALDFTTLVGQQVTLLGYGMTNSSEKVDTTLELNKPLQVLDGIAVKCAKGGKLTPALCVARRCGQASSACQGDSGGPMVHESGIAGVISMGSPDIIKFCNLKSLRPIYEVGAIAPISPLIDWIVDTINS